MDAPPRLSLTDRDRRTVVVAVWAAIAAGSAAAAELIYLLIRWLVG